MNALEKQLGQEGLHARGIETLQVSVGLRCNQTCAHCHLECSPARPETMDWDTMSAVKSAAVQAEASLVDITGGSPELNPHLRRFIGELRDTGLDVQVRTNLTVLRERGQEGMIDFLRDHAVGLVASMPCYLEENVNAQRGPAVYQRSIEVIRRLNEAGYGIKGGLQLNLVYNPAGAFLPPEQEALEQDYRRELQMCFGISFSRLLTIANMPLGRFASQLKAEDRQAQYMRLLEESFNPATVPGLMCRHQVSIGWDGTLYDCDFNLALKLPVNHSAPDHISRFDPALLACRRIVTGQHCLGCTAGHGSSCGGSLA
ncbi:MAG TPA: radical SAM/Cys-rich domain protein [Phycisphaerae bacterium]|nr:radical SAM/Cys-rich domain protein [Phycisphaerae bacterium]HDZ45175.1 radical SAM/Cys-rich domain protein [Phycisphaerae bacterium]